MNDLIQQEIFEIEVLTWLKNKGFLRNLIFGGGTMLRLCYNLKRYSVDLDFWTYRVDKIDQFFINLKDSLKMVRIPEYPDGNSEGIRTLNRNIRTSYRFNFY